MISCSSTALHGVNHTVILLLVRLRCFHSAHSLPTRPVDPEEEETRDAMRSYTQNATNRTGPIAVRAATKRPSIFENFQNSPPNTHYFQDIPSHAVFRKHHQSANFLYSVPLHPSASAASSSSVCRCQPRVIPRRCPLILLHNSSSDFRVVVHLPPPPSSAVPSSVRPTAAAAAVVVLRLRPPPRLSRRCRCHHHRPSATTIVLWSSQPTCGAPPRARPLRWPRVPAAVAEDDDDDGSGGR